AAGARTRNILQQFLTEALVVSAIGGAIGVAGGLGTAALLQALGTPVQFSGAPVALAFGCAFLTGLVFGWLPANNAARLDPVVALSKNGSTELNRRRVNLGRESRQRGRWRP